MFLTERLFGVGVYVSILAITCFALSRSGSHSYKRILSLYLLAIGILAYLYVPYVQADLDRLVEYMFVYADMSWPDFMQAIGESNAPVTLVYYRLIGSLHIAGLLSGITTLIVFWNVFHIIKGATKKISAHGTSVALTLLAIMSTGLYMQTVGNIRTMLAFSIIARAFYSESFNNRPLYKNIVWYIIAALIHPAAVVAVAIRFGVLFVNTARKRMTRKLLGMSLVLVPTVVLLLKYGASLIDNVLEKADVYINEVTYTYLWDNVISLLIIALLIIALIVNMRHPIKSNKTSLNDTMIMSVVLILFSLATMFEHATFVRFTQLNLMISAPLLLSSFHTLSSQSTKTRKSTIVTRALITIIVVILVISATRGALSSLKFFVL